MEVSLKPEAIAEQRDGVTWVCRFCGEALASSAHKCEGLDAWFQSFLTNEAGRALMAKSQR